LIGKGGFSEVYKAFDFQELRYVACKIHQLNKSWKNNVRLNYVKHALRENQVLKALEHKNILSHFDSVEIDPETFASILEYCDGKDLETYIRMQKMIPEKEALSIIK
jgi:tousled-like kinase